MKFKQILPLAVLIDVLPVPFLAGFQS